MASVDENWHTSGDSDIATTYIIREKFSHVALWKYIGTYTGYIINIYHCINKVIMFAKNLVTIQFCDHPYYRNFMNAKEFMQWELILE